MTAWWFGVPAKRCLGARIEHPWREALRFPALRGLFDSLSRVWIGIFLEPPLTSVDVTGEPTERLAYPQANCCKEAQNAEKPKGFSASMTASS